MTWVRGPWALVIVLVLALAGCAEPTYTYVANTTQNAYFKVPRAWKPVDSTVLQKAINNGVVKKSRWTVGFDASADPTPEHVFGTLTSEPFVYATAYNVSSTMSNEMSYDSLRDSFLPVTSQARAVVAQEGFPLTGFRLLATTLLAPGQGVHGVRQIFDYTFPDGVVVTFDQIAETNATQTQLYMLVVHCTAACYLHNRAEIDTVMNSFTVRSSG
jgi:hypothetical protein